MQRHQHCTVCVQIHLLVRQGLGIPYRASQISLSDSTLASAHVCSFHLTGVPPAPIWTSSLTPPPVPAALRRARYGWLVGVAVAYPPVQPCAGCRPSSRAHAPSAQLPIALSTDDPAFHLEPNPLPPGRLPQLPALQHDHAGLRPVQVPSPGEPATAAPSLLSLQPPPPCSARSQPATAAPSLRVHSRRRPDARSCCCLCPACSRHCCPAHFTTAAVCID